MKPIKDAIKQLECMATNLMGEVQNGNGLATLNYVALDVAIQALQEKLERENGCEYCMGDTKELIDGETTLFITRDDEAFYADWNGQGDLEFKFCPMCGRKLKPKGV